MRSMLFAERAILVELQSFRIVFLILHTVIIPVLAFGALESDFCSVYSSHFKKTPCKKITPGRCVLKVYHKVFALSIIFIAESTFFFTCAAFCPKNPANFYFFRFLCPKSLPFAYFLFIILAISDLKSNALPIIIIRKGVYYHERNEDSRRRLLGGRH